jgi:hypothetical protein
MNKNSTTEAQRKIADLLKVNISKDSRAVAAARIRSVVDFAINPNAKFRPVTQRQLKFAKSLGLDVSNDTFWVCIAKIGDRLGELNRQALDRLQLKPGDRVIKSSVVNLNGTQHKIKQEFTVSSIGKNGRVYFKGGAGASAWATQIKKTIRTTNERKILHK